jgi:3-methyladenine DNA glycosylase AlkD
MAGWAHSDCFACFAGGVAWRFGAIEDGVVARWARSGDRWWRRAALVSTVPLNCRARGAEDPQPDRTLAICELLLDDRDDMVVKAMSWALRELAKRDPRPVERFLLRHDRRIAARVRREVGNKLTTGLKAKPRLDQRLAEPLPSRTPRL